MHRNVASALLKDEETTIVRGQQHEVATLYLYFVCENKKKTCANIVHTTYCHYHFVNDPVETLVLLTLCQQNAAKTSLRNVFILIKIPVHESLY